MTSTVEQAFVNQFKRGIRMLSQQKGSRLQAGVRVEDQEGEFAFYDRLGSVDAVNHDVRHGDTPLQEAPHSRRRVGIRPVVYATLLDDADSVRILNDPTNAYSRAAMMALGRAKDDRIIEAATGTAYAGKQGETSVALPAAQQIAVDYVASGSATNSGLTIDKLIQARSILGKADVDDDIPLHIAVTQQQLDDMLRVEKVQSADYNTIKALVQGEINTFVGFTFHRTQRLSLDSSTDYRTCFAWAGGDEGGLLLAVGMNDTGKITERSDKNYATQVYYSNDVGATRLEDEMVVQILCDESP